MPLCWPARWRVSSDPHADFRGTTEDRSGDRRTSCQRGAPRQARAARERLAQLSPRTRSDCSNSVGYRPNGSRSVTGVAGGAQEGGIRSAKDTGLTNLPLHDFAQNQISCAIVALACELLAWLPDARLHQQRRQTVGTQTAPTAAAVHPRQADPPCPTHPPAPRPNALDRPRARRLATTSSPTDRAPGPAPTTRPGAPRPWKPATPGPTPADLSHPPARITDTKRAEPPIRSHPAPSRTASARRAASKRSRTTP